MRPSTRPHSIAIANLNVSGELSPSDSEDAATLSQPAGAADEADNVIGVSMGYIQSRLKARSTPAEEKNRIMERNAGYFDNPEGLFVPEITEEPEAFADTAEEKGGSSAKPSAPMALKAGGSSGGGGGGGARSSFTRSLLKSTLPLRPRAWSGDSSTAHRGLKKFFPSLHLRSASLAPRRPRSWSSKLNLERETSPAPEAAFPRPDPPPVTNDATTGVPAEDPIGELRPLQSPSARTPGKHSFVRSNSALRRSSSDQSLYLRASSTASSLEHRPQYEHIHSQTNSRLKAIKDTLQDSSNRLLSMPSLHFQDLRSEWAYRQFLSDPSHRKAEATDSSLGSTVTSATLPEIRAPAEEAPPRTRSPRSSIAAAYPTLYEAMNELTGDIVVMGGYRGSILRSAKPPHRQLWVPMKVGLNLRKVDLEVGLTREDEERMEETIIPDGVLSHIGPVDICRRLLKRLQKCDNSVRGDLRVHNYGYDWRLSPHLLSQRLIRYLEGLPCNAPDVPPHKRGAWVIAHSLGGLITRHAVNQRPELFAGVLYAGVPQHCVNILGPLRNGDDVLFSSRVLTAQVNFTFRTSFALLPEEGQCFINKHTKEEYRINYFDPEVWDEYRLSPCINPPFPTPAPTRTGSSSLSLMDKNLTMRKRFSTILSNSSSFSSTDKADLYSSPPNSTDSFPSTTTVKASNVMLASEGLVGPSASPRGSFTILPTQQPVTIPPEAAREYLKRTLAEIAAFRQETQHDAQHQESNKYPPFAVLYSKCIPTVYGARVSSREAIKYADAYDDLAFAAGDGVCLASAAMLPTGYKVIRDGLVKSERGHVGLLGDLEGIGACLQALVKGRREGVGVSSSPSYLSPVPSALQ
ncbi:hypothetical protein BJX63DRAFT_349131 [Aspergillus granulosus]|uniref:Uncharacterized protein n=1 Tax=Aspergillus granulosus TaxID=176169 RepID=A0ABR4H482_9EURO